MAQIVKLLEDILEVIPGVNVEDSYPYFLGITSDTLVIISVDDNGKQFLVDTIVKGKDMNGLLLGADDEDTFLEAVHAIKNLILDGLNPITVLKLKY